MEKVSLDGHSGPWTEEEFLALDESFNKIELIDGSLWVTPEPNRRHNDIASALSTLLRPPALTAGLRVRTTVSVRLAPRRIVSPDLVIEREPSDLVFGDVSGVVLTCEVTSPSNAAYDQSLKMQVYAEAGIPWHLLAEPDFGDYRSVSLHLFQLRDKQYAKAATAKHGETLISADPIPMSLSTNFLIDF
ncbi:Uma2 family endonuclease [Actinoplanes sp. NEAU-A12]|uniref:Uma2 family endonuclease n=1 Tax=Actinoplanes sandaracinus TaxID=3045177 RepID=A0ABT6WMD8_9ACTN|nr:Uma2 family endonuclease [Actinoplanes sandaracinus]MDI6100878.1 Uma2 family endonuclease [Actinoplanes sandaracinus]